MRKISLAILVVALLTQMPLVQADQTVNLFAASSMTKTFSELSTSFEKNNPKIRIRLVFSSSKILANQILGGANADIFLSASPEDMIKVTNGSNYLVNRVVIGISKNSSIKSVRDLDKGYKWIRCADEVPCGSVANSALKAEGIESSPLSLEPMSSSVIAKLLAGEVDAAVIYKSDAIANRKKIGFIEFTNKKKASTTYQIAKLTKNKATIKFYNFLRSKSVLNYLQNNGFEAI